VWVESSETGYAALGRRWEGSGIWHQALGKERHRGRRLLGAHCPTPNAQCPPNASCLMPNPLGTPTASAQGPALPSLPLDTESIVAITAGTTGRRGRYPVSNGEIGVPPCPHPSVTTAASPSRSRS